MSALVLHRDPDCTGTWDARRTLLYRRWVYRCTRCGVQHESTQATAHATGAENERGRMLAQLSDAGALLVNTPLPRSLPRRPA